MTIPADPTTVCSTGNVPPASLPSTFATNVLMDLADLHANLASRKQLDPVLRLRAARTPSGSVFLTFAPDSDLTSGPSTTFEQALIRLTGAMARRSFAHAQEQRAKQAKLLTFAAEPPREVELPSGAELGRAMNRSSTTNAFDVAMAKLVEAFGTDYQLRTDSQPHMAVHFVCRVTRESEVEDTDRKFSVLRRRKVRAIDVALSPTEAEAPSDAFVSTQNIESSIEKLIAQAADDLRSKLNGELQAILPYARYMEFAPPPSQKREK